VANLRLRTGRAAADRVHGGRRGGAGGQSPGKFSAWLPPGRYRVVWRSPAIITVTDSGHEEQTSSQAPSVTISTQHAATITLVAIVP
jgi:hypothetical protein